MARPNLFSIAPHAPFLPTLVARILDGTLPRPADGPFGLADLTILVPTQRARVALADAFLQQCGPALLLPDIRTLGDTDGEEEPFLPPYDAEPLPPTVPPMVRRLVLAQMIAVWIQTRDRVPFSTPGASGFASPPSPGEILALSDSLGQLIDDCHTEGVLPQAFTNLPPEDLSAHWQEALAFLDIALKAWPDYLAERGEVDLADQRNARLARMAEIAPLVYGNRPVIAAGSTGSIPATAKLLAAIARLPNGALVLPGLDTGLTPETHAALLDPANAPHGHSQYGLARLLERNGAGIGETIELAPASAPRTEVMRRALALAPDTAAWSEQRPSTEVLESALSGVTILAAANEHEEARAVALAARKARSEDKSVGIVTPDRNLARRIAAELNRFGIAVDDSAGVPLFQSRAGRLMRQAIALIDEGWAAVPLVALLRNRHVTLGRPRSQIAALTDMLELAVLRGQRPGAGADGLRAAIAANRDDQLQRPRIRLDETRATDLVTFVDTLELALAPVQALAEGGAFRASDLARSIGAVLDALTGAGTPDEAIPEGAEGLRRWTEETAGLTGDGPPFGGHQLAEAFEGLVAGRSVRAPAPPETGISIWGLLEARLLSPDVTILAGLNEGVWPGPADPGPWLSRNMAISLGLEPEERRQGQMAHDFEIAAGGGEVIFALARRVGGSPALPSRLLQRLEAFIGETAAQTLHARGATIIAQARMLDSAGAPVPAARPMPCPPAAIRPRKLSITEVERLIRSPYDIYARRVLRLNRLDDLGADPGQRERGTLVHDVFAKAAGDGFDPADPEALNRILALADAVFAGLDTAPERRAVWRRRLETQGARFIDYELGRAPDIAQRKVEIDGEMRFPVAGQDFTLYGRADRIDLRHDTGIEIIDFKTGAIPPAKDMRDFLAPQLLVEAAMVRAGAFEDVPAGTVEGLTYIRLPSDPNGFEDKAFALPNDMDITQAADAIMRALQTRIEAYLLSDTQPMTARILPNPKQTFAGDYDHLARTAEWTAIGEDGEGDA